MDAPELIKALRRIGYELVRQSGSHIRLRCDQPVAHALTVPNHAPIKLGTLAAIVQDIASTRRISKEELIRQLWGD
jgi:predicted RNA binding protein YcfA (HicA-like mRNA interferase family)